MPILKNIHQRKIILDTHIWIWLMEGRAVFNQGFLKAIDYHQASKEGILISAISVWEVGMLVEKRRLEFEVDCLEWVEKALMQEGVDLVPINPQIAIQSTRLPGVVHADSADRLLIATAREMNATLVTCDQEILKFGRNRFIHVHNPKK